MFSLPLAASTTHDALWALCFAIGAGSLLSILAHKLKLPSIVLLLIGGFVFGPEGLSIIDPESLGGFLPMIVSLAVGLILFEGGLTLDIKEFSQTSKVIRRLLTVGVIVTWLGVALTVYWVFDVGGSFALLMGSLVIVTGPTVIAPLLRRIRVQQKVASILHWEAVLIDTIGVFIAILCFEWVVEGGGAVALPNFLIRIVSGAALGSVGGYVIYWIMKRGWVPDNSVNAFSLAAALLVFGATEFIKPEAGLLSVTIAGLIVGLNKQRQLRDIKAFKAEIVDLLIGMLFLLLVARLEIQQFIDFFNVGGGWVLLAIMVIIRPLCVLISARRTPLNWREKALLSWISPRGVVAASMTSLFALTLQEKEGVAGNPDLLESFVYSVICATVLLQGLSAGRVARLLGLQRPAPNNWVIIGAHHFGREIARQLRDVEVVLLDTNARNIALAREEGLTAIHGDGLEAEKLYSEEELLFATGYVLALTDNIELNELLMQRWADLLPNENVYGWIPVNSPSNEDQITGQFTFGDLSRPSVIGSELMQGESNFERVTWEEGKTLPSGDWHPLFIQRGKMLKPVPCDTALKENVREDDEVICLRRSEGFLLRALQAGSFIQVDCNNIDSLYEELAAVADTHVDALQKEQILDDLSAQGKVFPAFLGHGLAIPHVYCGNLQHRVCIVASLSRGITIPGQAEAVDFVFFLISPLGDTEGHLATLAEIARTCHNERPRKLLKKARSIEDVIAVISN